ncbi:MAG TPA: hypothetical protein VGK50_08755 [Coriobacteriia bacterium]|jgi:hypothetical protein
MADELSELLKSLKAAKDLLPPATAEEEEPAPGGERGVLPPRPDQQGERKVSLGDVAKARKDYEREPLDKK